MSETSENDFNTSECLFESESEGGESDVDVKKSKRNFNDIITHAMKINEKDYEITISPPPPQIIKCEFSGGTIQRFKEHYESLAEDIITPLSQFCNKLILFPELSYTGRLHFHGIVNFKDYCTWLVTCMIYLEKKCKIEINEYEPEYWDKYMTKDQKMITQFLKANKMKEVLTFPSPPKQK